MSARSSEKQRQGESSLDENQGLPFSIPLEQEVVSGSPLPGCIHLQQAGLGQVAWRIRVRAQGLNLLATPKLDTGLTSLSIDKKVHVEEFEIHLTPCRADPPRAYGEGSVANAGPSSPSESSQKVTAKTVTGGSSRILAGTACKMVLSTVKTSNTESIAVGVEICSEEQLDEDSIKWLKGLRRVRIQWWRRVTVTSSEDESDSRKASTRRESLTLLHKSGKLCRYSQDRQKPIRLLFELPPLRNVLFNAHSATALGGVGCGDVSQETLIHQVHFFVRVIVESRSVGNAVSSAQASGSSTVHQPSTVSEGDPIVLEQEVRVLPPSWQQLLPYVVTVDERGLSDSAAIAQALQEDELRGEPESMLNEDARGRAYRLKGSDVVGSTGTFRQEGAIAASSSGKPPSFEAQSYPAGGEGSGDPPPFSEAAGTSGDALPSFDESERHNRSRSSLSAPPKPRTPGSSSTPAPAQLTGELASWREYDGYETFSAPPPAAWASLGLSGSMDPPSADDADMEAAHGNTALGGADERVRLMEQLGLGEGTRVIDTHEDMPPGFDEPSLPSLPNAIMPHHRRAMQRNAVMPMDVVGESASPAPLDESPPPPAFTRDATLEAVGRAGNHAASGTRQVLPPPSFADSEAAEARGMAATGPEPIANVVLESTISPPLPALEYHHPGAGASAPPVYTDENHPAHSEAPPGYSRAH